MSPNRLKEISDPILQLMSELHKLIAVTQAPPPTTPHPRRQLVELYKRSLFSSGSKPEDLKAELHRVRVCMWSTVGLAAWVKLCSVWLVHLADRVLCS